MIKREMAPNDILSALKDGLETDLGLQQVSLSEGYEVFSDKNALVKFLMADRITQPVRFVTAQVHECQVHGLVVCPITQTIGVIQIVSTPEEGDAESRKQELRTVVHKHVREAVALRHELLQKRSDKKISYNVELILVANESNAIARISDVLQSFIQKSSYLHSIGVSIFVDSNSKGFRDQANLRRVFPWLLQSVRSWYESATFQKKFELPPGSEKQVALGDTMIQRNAEIKKLKLRNFRLRGERVWELEPEHALHVIHGNNGTGKSTFTESFELLLTGKLEKLEAEDLSGRYLDVLKNSKAPESEEATLTLSLSKGELEWKVVQTGIRFAGKSSQPSGKKSKSTNVQPGSFRLDQKFADSLVRVSEGGRATEFLRAFFPETQSTVEADLAAEQKFKKQWNSLTPNLKKILSETKSEIPNPHLIAKKLKTVSGSVASLRKIELIPDIAGLLEEGISFGICESPENDSLSEHDRVWQLLTKRATELKVELEEVLEFTLKVNNWSASSAVRTSEKSTLDLMVQWLDATAKCDLLRKEIQLLSFVKESPKKEKQFLISRLNPSELPRFQNQSTKLQQELGKKDELFRQLQAEEKVTENLKNETVSQGIAPKLNERIRYWYQRNLAPVSALPGPPVVEQLQAALRDKVSVNFRLRASDNKRNVSEKKRLVKIGEKGGAWAIVEFLNTKINVANRIIAANDQMTESLEQVYNQVRSLRNAARKYDDSRKESLAEFSSQISSKGELGKAINELTALFTPAQWAYDDVESTMDEEGGVGITVPGNDVEGKGKPVNADLRLNTAELNTLAIVLFLLCAPDQKNALRMLVLDDPFQNMDELTVTTIARGLNRLMAIWKKNSNLEKWRMTILLHGEENLERLRRECYCKAYFLPWLTPQTESSHPPKIEHDLPRYKTPRAESLSASNFMQILPHKD